MIWLNGKAQNLPAFLLTSLLNEMLTALFDLAHQHWFASSRTPYEMIDNQVNMVLISLVLKCLFHGLSLAYLRPGCKG